MRIYVNDMDSTAIKRLFAECDSFKNMVRDYATDVAFTLIEDELLFDFAGTYSIGYSRSDYVELGWNQQEVGKWFTALQNRCEEFNDVEAQAITAFIEASDEDYYTTKRNAGQVILDHMQDLICSYEECAEDFIEEAVDSWEAIGYFTEDFTRLYREVPAHISEV